MLWRIFQALVGFAVLSANIYFQWTPNGVHRCGVGFYGGLCRYCFSVSSI